MKEKEEKKKENRKEINENRKKGSYVIDLLDRP